MTTAHRPQESTMRGGGSMIQTQGGYFTGGRTLQTSAKDMPAHMKLKYRQSGQADSDSIAARDLRRELEEKERAHFKQVRKEWERKKGIAATAALNVGNSNSASAPLLEDAKFSSSGGGGGGGVGASDVDAALAAFDDADDDALDKLAGESDDEDNEDDDELELLRELERIKKEREEERARKERELSELAAKDTAEAILKGNPLLTKGMAAALGSAGSTSYGAPQAHSGGALKRRFGDDTVFSHTHAGEPEAKKRFLNDSLRSDFHRSFMRRFFQ